jgi:hypothetical protein
VKLNVALQFQGAAPPPTRLVSSHPAVLATDGDVVRGLAPGNATLLIMLADRDAVIDFLHVWVAEPDALALTVASGSGRVLGDAVSSVQLVPGDDLIVTPRLSARQLPLLGAPAIAWSLEGPAVTLLREEAAASEVIRLVARAPGQATLTAHAGALSAALQVEVEP